MCQECGCQRLSSCTKGHDSRIGIKPNVIEKAAGDGEWPSDWSGEGKVVGKKADPDNAGKNPEGDIVSMHIKTEANRERGVLNLHLRVKGINIVAPKTGDMLYEQ